MYVSHRAIKYYRAKGQYQYIGGSKFSNWGGVGMPDSSYTRNHFGPALPENYFLPSPFLHDEHRAQQTRERINLKIQGNRQSSHIYQKYLLKSWKKPSTARSQKGILDWNKNPWSYRKKYTVKIFTN